MGQLRSTERKLCEGTGVGQGIIKKKKNQKNQSVIDKNGVDMGRDISHSYNGVDADSSLQ